MAVIVTVLATLSSGRVLEDVSAGPWATFLAVEAAVILLFAGVYAWRTVLPRRYKVADRDKLRTIVESPVYWAGDPRIGTRRSAESLLDSLDSARTGNGHKAWDLVASMGLGLVGVARSPARLSRSCGACESSRRYPDAPFRPSRTVGGLLDGLRGGSDGL